MSEPKRPNLSVLAAHPNLELGDYKSLKMAERYMDHLESRLAEKDKTIERWWREARKQLGLKQCAESMWSDDADRLAEAERLLRKMRRAMHEENTPLGVALFDYAGQVDAFLTETPEVAITDCDAKPCPDCGGSGKKIVKASGATCETLCPRCHGTGTEGGEG